VQAAFGDDGGREAADEEPDNQAAFGDDGGREATDEEPDNQTAFALAETTRHSRFPAERATLMR